MSVCSRQEAEVLAAAAAMVSSSRQEARKEAEAASCLAEVSAVAAAVDLKIQRSLKSHQKNFIILVWLLVVLESIL